MTPCGRFSDDNGAYGIGAFVGLPFASTPFAYDAVVPFATSRATSSTVAPLAAVIIPPPTTFPDASNNSSLKDCVPLGFWLSAEMRWPSTWPFFILLTIAVPEYGSLLISKPLVAPATLFAIAGRPATVPFAIFMPFCALPAAAATGREPIFPTCRSPRIFPFASFFTKSADNSPDLLADTAEHS